jgi:tetratricopeptide (TPR) repeat protein
MRTVLILTFAFASTSLHAAQTIFGSSTAMECYQMATFGPRLNDRDPCDDAISTGGLTRADLAATYSNRGIILASGGEYDRAISDHDTAIRLDPQSARAYVNRANTLFRAGRYAEALADYDRAVELSAGGFALAYYNRSFVHRALDQKDAARKDLEQAAALAPDVAAYREALKGVR